MSSDPPPEFLPLFTDEDEFSLCEGDTDPANYVYYELGQMVAHLHSRGLMHGDLHRGNVLFDKHKARVRLIDFESSRFHTEPEPGSMVREFLAPFVDFERSEFISFLSGYVRSAFIHIEPKRPGFVDELMWMIGGRITEWPRPRSSLVEAEQLTRDLGVHLTVQNGRVCFDGDAVARFTSRIQARPEESFIFLAGLTICGIDYSPLLLRQDNSRDSRQTMSIRNLTAAATRLSRSVSQPKSEVTRLATQFFSQCADSLESDKLDADDQPMLQGLEVLVRMAQSGTGPVKALNQIFDGVIDICDWASAFLDSQSETSKSLAFAQFALMLFRYSIPEAQREESRWVYLECAQQSRSWRENLLDDGAPESEIFEQLAYKLAYTGSVCNVLSRIYKTSLTINGPMTSFLWAATKLYRRAIARIHKELLGAAVPQQLAFFEKTALSMLKGLLACHKEHQDNTLLYPEIYFDRDAGVLVLTAELEATLKLLEEVPKHGLASDRCRDLLAKLREYAP
jgi:hypothetical protein